MFSVFELFSKLYSSLSNTNICFCFLYLKNCIILEDLIEKQNTENNNLLEVFVPLSISSIEEMVITRTGGNGAKGSKKTIIQHKLSTHCTERKSVLDDYLSVSLILHLGRLLTFLLIFARNTFPLSISQIRKCSQGNVSVITIMTFGTLPHCGS